MTQKHGLLDNEVNYHQIKVTRTTRFDVIVVVIHSFVTVIASYTKQIRVDMFDGSSNNIGILINIIRNIRK